MWDGSSSLELQSTYQALSDFYRKKLFLSPTSG